MLPVGWGLSQSHTSPAVIPKEPGLSVYAPPGDMLLAEPQFCPSLIQLQSVSWLEDKAQPGS